MAMSIRTTVCLALALAGLAAPARAATITSDAFVAIAGPTIAFLDASARLALARGEAPRLHALARAELASQDRAGRTLDGWRRADADAIARAAGGTTLDRLGPLAGVLKLPYDAVADATSFASPPLTGLPSPDRLRATSQQDLARLGTLSGAAFTDLYRQTQTAALNRLVAVYEDFILNGDDPILRRLAVRELPTSKGLLARARRL